MELIKRYYISIIKTAISEVFNYHRNFSSSKVILGYISDFIYKNIPCFSCNIKEKQEGGSYSIVLNLYDSVITIDFNLISYSGTTSSQLAYDFIIDDPIKNLEVKVCSY